MLDGLKALKPDSFSDFYLFGAGESGQIAKVRKYLRENCIPAARAAAQDHADVMSDCE